MADTDTGMSVWTSREAEALVRRGDVGGLIRLGRTARGWHLSDLGDAVGYSVAALSRLERRPVSLAPLYRVTDAVGIPRHVLGRALG
ncbi:helix-turn-helix domain-containing protein [Yinghuangia aomiensis]